MTDYTYALDILDKYDHQELTIEGTTSNELFIINYAEAKTAIADLKDKFGGSMLFGNEKGDSFRGSLGAIYQTFGGIDLYPSVGGKSCQPIVFCRKESFLFRRKQKNCGLSFCLVYGQERHLVYN